MSRNAHGEGHSGKVLHAFTSRFEREANHADLYGLMRRPKILALARVLWGFNIIIMKAKTQDGKTIEPDLFAFTPVRDSNTFWLFLLSIAHYRSRRLHVQALALIPAPFECDIQPRSSRHAIIIRQDFVNATPVCSEYEQELEEDDRDWLAQVRQEAGSS